MQGDARMSEDVQKYIQEYRDQSDEWLLEQCRSAKGKRLLAIYMLLVERGFTSEDIGN